jgi:DNA-directed RNA polymerase subunit beta'
MVDHLIGLKENVIIGKPIPAGTGMKRYRNVKLDSDMTEADEITLSEEDDILLDGEEDDTLNLTEDNIAEEVLAFDDMADVEEDAPETEPKD